ncbi:hypothetical protein [Acinetobacter colistiniresistens]|uniref:hypothetical protein n=1 Tax=Acinetobacter colistiniresistens TaxID=280145 RepID=UPI0012507AA7|nr:hypothetical protein [Acinetobacter colistiniresistens]
MKTNFSVDLAFFITAMSIFLFACGFFYINSYIGFYGYNPEILGYSFQNYLVIGGINGAQGICFILLILLAISLINGLRNKNILNSAGKAIAYIFTTLIVFIYNILYKSILRHIVIFFKFLFTEVRGFKHLYLLLRTIFKNLIKLFSFFFKSSLVEAHDYSKESVDWNDNTDSKNIDNGLKELLTHYIYLVVVYVLLFSSVFYLSNIETEAKAEANERMKKAAIVDLIVKDEMLNEYFKIIKIENNEVLKAKILKCGPTNCLIAIDTGQSKT